MEIESDPFPILNVERKSSHTKSLYRDTLDVTSQARWAVRSRCSIPSIPSSVQVESKREQASGRRLSANQLRD